MDVSIGTIIVFAVPAIIFFTLVIVAFVLFKRVSDTAKAISQVAYGTSDIIQGIKKQQYEYSTTPKTVSAATSLYLPQIKKDFPEFSYEEAGTRARNALVSYLRAIDQNNPTLLTEGSDELKDQLRHRINMLRDVGQREQFDKISLHQTAISRYFKEAGRCSIVFQTSLQYKHSLHGADGSLLKGNPESLEQSRYNVTMAYVQDADMSNDGRDYALGLTCPQCGAPVTNLGQKVCEFCGSGLVPVTRMTWNVVDIQELK